MTNKTPFPVITMIGDAPEEVKPVLSAQEQVDATFAKLAERSPRINDSVRRIWGSIECDRYLAKLMLDERGNRQGFPEDIFSLLLKLSLLQHELFNFAPLTKDPWHSVTK